MHLPLLISSAGELQAQKNVQYRKDRCWAVAAFQTSCSLKEGDCRFSKEFIWTCSPVGFTLSHHPPEKNIVSLDLLHLSLLSASTLRSTHWVQLLMAVYFRHFAVKLVLQVTWELMGGDKVGWMELEPGVSTLAGEKAAPYLQYTQMFKPVSAFAQIKEKLFLSK